MFSGLQKDNVEMGFPPSFVILEASDGEAEAPGAFFVVILEASIGEAEGSGRGEANPGVMAV
ncbi:MAG TPA: hypothetical protein VLH15_06670 [Dehalococcoidales bacterium]|nr:hypothetical protein [Dehalococcoidales bacterium]